jgi:hypothetical protein
MVATLSVESRDLSIESGDSPERAATLYGESMDLSVESDDSLPRE